MGSCTNARFTHIWNKNLFIFFQFILDINFKVYSFLYIAHWLTSLLPSQDLVIDLSLCRSSQVLFISESVDLNLFSSLSAEEGSFYWIFILIFYCFAFEKTYQRNSKFTYWSKWICNLMTYLQCSQLDDWNKTLELR